MYGLKYSVKNLSDICLREKLEKVWKSSLEIKAQSDAKRRRRQIMI